MPFIYPSHTPRDKNDKRKKPSIEQYDATAYWVHHYSNKLRLDAISKNKYRTFNERQQAREEMDIADRKMKFWERQKNFDMNLARRMLGDGTILKTGG